VVPIVSWGAHDILGPYRRWPHLLPRKTMQVHAGPPLTFDDLQGRPASAEVLHEATDRIMAALVSDLEAVRGQRAPGIRFDPRAHGVTPIGKPRPLKEAS
jgi:1-acyl-sn-glycerol-3-phosphate acyltransferase